MRSIPLRPDQVPAAVDDDLLRATITHGQPPAVSEARNAVEGAGPVVDVLFLHGLGHDSWDWAPMIAARGPAIRAHAWDAPGFGQHLLQGEPQPITLDDLVDDLLARAAACQQANAAQGPDRNATAPVVVASSLGGHVALMAAMKKPEAFAGLFLLAPGGLVEAPRPTAALLRRYYSVDAIKSRPIDEVVQNSRRIFIHQVEHADVLAARKVCWYRASDAMKHRFAVPFASIVDDVLERPILRQVEQLRGRMPMEVVFGEGDVVVPLSAGRSLERLCDAHLTIRRGIGHCPHLEEPEAMARHLDQWLGHLGCLAVE